MFPTVHVADGSLIPWFSLTYFLLSSEFRLRHSSEIGSDFQICLDNVGWGLCSEKRQESIMDLLAVWRMNILYILCMQGILRIVNTFKK